MHGLHAHLQHGRQRRLDEVLGTLQPTQLLGLLQPLWQHLQAPDGKELHAGTFVAGSEQGRHRAQLLQQAADRVITPLLSEAQCRHTPMATQQRRAGPHTGRAAAAAASIWCTYADLRCFSAPLTSSVISLVANNAQRLDPELASRFLLALGAFAPSAQADGLKPSDAARAAAKVLQALRVRELARQRSVAAMAAADVMHSVEEAPAVTDSPRRASEAGAVPGLGLTQQQALAALSGLVQLDVGAQELPLRHVVYDLTMPTPSIRQAAKGPADRPDASPAGQQRVNGRQEQGWAQGGEGSADNQAGLIPAQALAALQVLEVLQGQRKGALAQLPRYAWCRLEQLAGWQRGDERASAGASMPPAPLDLTAEQSISDVGTVDNQAEQAAGPGFEQGLVAVLQSLGCDLRTQAAAEGSYFSVCSLGLQRTGPGGTQAMQQGMQGAGHLVDTESSSSPGQQLQGEAGTRHVPGGTQLLVLEPVQDSWQCTVNPVPHLLGSVATRHEHLRRLGHRVFVVRQGTWERLGTDAARRSYLQARLQQVQLGGAVANSS